MNALILQPLIFNLGPTELIIILVIVLLLFGGSRLAGLGKSSGRALKEFKEETKGLREKDEPGQGGATANQTPQIAPYPPQQSGSAQPQQNGYGQPQQNGYGQQQAPQQQPYADNAYPPAPGNVEQPADRDLRRDV